MAAALRRYSYVNVAGSFTKERAFTVVPASKALVISKLVLTPATGTTITVYASIQPGLASVPNFINNLTLASGEHYTETGLVVLAGESVVVETGLAAGLYVSIFGQEVDN